MKKIGYFGKLVFRLGVNELSGRPEMLSFNELQWNMSVNFTEHVRHGKKPLLEMTSRNCDTVSMKIYFMASLGVNPVEMVVLLRDYNREAKVFPLVIGGKRFATHKYVISDVSNEIRTISFQGKITQVIASVTFKEYPDEVNPKKRKVVKKKSVDTLTETVTDTLKGYERYVVKRDDTLWSIAKEHYGNPVLFQKIIHANRVAENGFDAISHSDSICAGCVIKLPD